MERVQPDLSRRRLIPKLSFGNARRGLGLLVVGVALAICTAAHAQTKPVRIIVPYPAGGTQDAMMRALQEPLGKRLEQQVIIENRPGAAGMIGTQEVQRSAPDGATLGLVNNGMVITPLITRGVNLELEKDLTPISLIAAGPLVLFAHPSVPAESVSQLLDYAKKQPNGLNYGSTGPGGLGHMTAELLARQSGSPLTHVPYKGNAPAMMAVLAGEVQFVISTVSDTTNQNVKAGKLKALAVSTLEPSPAVPGLPAISASVPGFGVTAWFGFVAPPGTPETVVRRLNAAIAEVMALGDVRQRFMDFGLVAEATGPATFRDTILQEGAKWRPVVQAAKIRVE
ncbi:MAG TPA: tripartite tricarboxylate transporter substrate-binding protein [Burkholderiaceae bacterium]|nr:tripartite tricarboxylate transporter substrate-binding protein [Burkholderiaceae bacterium]